MKIKLFLATSLLLVMAFGIIAILSHEDNIQRLRRVSHRQNAECLGVGVFFPSWSVTTMPTARHQSGIEEAIARRTFTKNDCCSKSGETVYSCQVRWSFDDYGDYDIFVKSEQECKAEQVNTGRATQFSGDPWTRCL